MPVADSWLRRANTIIAQYSRGQSSLRETERALLILFRPVLDDFMTDLNQWRDDAEKDHITKALITQAEEGLKRLQILKAHLESLAA